MTNPLAGIPARARLIAYILYAILGPVLIYSTARGWTGEAEYTLYVGLGAALGLTAAANISDPDAAYEVTLYRATEGGERAILTDDEITRGVPVEPWTPERPTHRGD